MTYRKSDGPFGMLPKKTAMDLESASGLYTVLPRSDVEPRTHRSPEPAAVSRPRESRPVTRGRRTMG